MVPRKGVGAGGGDAFGSCTFKTQFKTLAILRDYEYMISERKGGGGGGGGGGGHGPSWIRHCRSTLL